MGNNGQDIYGESAKKEKLSKKEKNRILNEAWEVLPDGKRRLRKGHELGKLVKMKENELDLDLPEHLSLEEIKKNFLQLGVLGLPILTKLMYSDKESVQLKALQMIYGKVMPEEYLHKVWKVVIDGSQGGIEKQLPQFGEYLTWKAQKELAEQSIDVEVTDATQNAQSS
jgi:hypothetical protein